MTNPPTGTVTFLFTDIEGSTALWEQNPEAMRAALERHHAILREAIAFQHGVIFNIAGDGICAAFASAGDALTAVLSAQRTLHQTEWGETVIRVRMGLHTGAAEAIDSGYRSGPTLNRAARIMSVARGGQVLLSQTTAGLLRGQLPEGVSLRDLGQHRLKGLAQTERLLQLVASELPSKFPALQSASITPNNLPVQLTSFIGRDRELAKLKRLLNTTRLLTLTGSGGTGKTRLSLQFAAEVLNQFRDGSWFVDLAPLADPDLIPQTVVSALRLREQPGQPLLATLTDHLHDKQLLLILDNCEHLIDASARLADTLLHAAPELRIVASSREALGIAGETTYHVPSLPVPNPKGDVSSANLETFDSVRLFIERASAAKSDFSLSGANASAIAQICSRLDGIPLAIELAAARVKALPVEAIAARLDDRFRLLTGGSRTALPRQQTLRGMIDWSHSLLSEPERVLLRRLSVFAGGWTIEAAEKVCGDDVVAAQTAHGGPPLLPQSDVLDLLTHLVDKSLVVLDGPAAEQRYHMLETVRQYTREKLLDAAEGEALRTRHRTFFARFAAEAAPHLYDADQIAWLARIEAEHENLRSAVEWFTENDDPVIPLQLAADLYWFWFTHGYQSEGVGRMRQVLANSQGSPLNASVARARISLEIGLSALMYGQGEIRQTKPLMDDALALAERFGIPEHLPTVYQMQGRIALDAKEFAAASVWLGRAQELARAAHDNESLGVTYWALGDVAYSLNEYALARSYYQQGLEIFQERGDLNREAYILRRLGYLALHERQPGEAEALIRESLRINLDLMERQGLIGCIAALAALRGTQGQWKRVASLFGSVESLLETMHATLLPIDQDDVQRNLALTRAALEPADFEAAWAEGRALTLEQAVAVAQQAPAAEQPVPSETPVPVLLADNTGLTARETEVLRLLAEGLSNDQIAERLVISAYTVRAHLRAIYSKLDVTTRSAATRYALEHHLV